MMGFIKSVVLFPAICGSALGLLFRLLEGWPRRELVLWTAYLGLMMLVWFPFLLVPYMRKRRWRI